MNWYLNMSPFSSPNYVGDSHLTNPKLLCYFALRYFWIQFPNFKNFFFSQLVSSTFFSSLIACSCAPFFRTIFIIICESAQPQMIRIDTSRNITRMANTQLARVNFIMQKISNAMWSFSFTSDPDFSTTNFIKRSLPQPAFFCLTCDKFRLKFYNVFFNKFHGNIISQRSIL